MYLNLSAPSDEVVKYCTMASTFYCTYTWETNQIERICFGVLEDDKTKIPTHLNGVIEQYVEGAKFLEGNESFIYSLAFSRAGNYIKIENDYSCSMVEFMKMGH